MPIPRTVFYLPRPSKSKYPGSFPLHFESSLFKLYPVDERKVLQPFGGKATVGVRTDLLMEVRPIILADAHHLPFRNGVFHVVLLDPPYGKKESKELYGTGPVKQKDYLAEAVRVTRPGGFVIHYHKIMIGWSCVKNCRADHLIPVVLRAGHSARICQVYQKRGATLENYLLTA